MQAKGDVSLYFESEICFSPDICLRISRMPVSELPKHISVGKLMSSQLLSGLAEIGSPVETNALALAQTAPEDDLLIQRFWPLDSVVRIFPCSYSLFIDQYFRANHIHSVVAIISHQTMFDDPFWTGYPREFLSSMEQFLKQFPNHSVDSLLTKSFAPLLIEESIGKPRVINQHKPILKNWQKSIAGILKKKKDIGLLKLSSGWCSAVLCHKKAETSSASVKIYRFDISESGSPVLLLDKIVNLLDGLIVKMNIDSATIDEVVVSLSSVRAATAMAIKFEKKFQTKVRIPSLVFGWNPIADFLQLFDGEKRFRIAVIMEKVPFVDIVVVDYGH